MSLTSAKFRNWKQKLNRITGAKLFTFNDFLIFFFLIFNYSLVKCINTWLKTKTNWVNEIFNHNRLISYQRTWSNSCSFWCKISLLFWNSCMYLVSLYWMIDKIISSSCISERESDFPSHLNFLTFNKRKELKQAGP